MKNLIEQYKAQAKKLNKTIVMPEGNEPRVIRAAAICTQEKLAKKLNTNQASYAHYENATNMIPTVFLYNLTTVYKPFSIDKLLGRKKQ